MKEQKASILPVFITVFIDLIGLGIIIPIIAPLLLNPHAGILPADMAIETKKIILGFLVASFPLAQFFGAPLLGAFSDRMGRKKILLLSLIGTMLGYVIFAYGITQHNIYIMFASRILDGFTGGNIAIVQSSISDLSDPKDKTRNFGMIGMAFGLGFILGPYIGGTFSEPEFVKSLNNFTGLSFSEFATPFWFAALLGFVNVISVIIQFKETLKSPKDTPISALTGFRNIGKAFRMTNLRTLFIVMFLFTLGFNFYTQFFNVYLMEKFSFTNKQIGDFFALIGICGALSQGFIIRPLAKKFHQSAMLRFSLLGLSIGILLQVFPTSAIGIYWAVPLIALCQGITFPNLNSLISQQADRKSQGEVFGISQSISSVGFAIPPILSGYINNIDKHLPIIIGSSFIFICWLVFVTMYKKPASQSEILK